MFNKKREGVLLELSVTELEDLTPNKSNRIDGVENSTQRSRMGRLKNSLRQYGFKNAYPIVLNTDLEIVSGHHRTQACIDLNMHAWVLIDPKADVIDYAAMESITNKWSVNDFVKAKVNAGNKNAKILEYLMKKFAFRAELVMRVEAGIHVKKSEIINTINNDEIMFADLNKLETNCQHVKDVLELLPVKGEKIAMAVIMLMKHPSYDGKIMKQKLKLKGGDLYPTPSTKGYMEQLQRFYNYGSRSNKIYFL